MDRSLRCRSTCPTSGSDAPHAACRWPECAAADAHPPVADPHGGRPTPSPAGSPPASAAGRVPGPCEHRPCRAVGPAIDQICHDRFPTSLGIGSRSTRFPLPRTVTSPARQSRSPSRSPATSAPRIPAAPTRSGSRSHADRPPWPGQTPQQPCYHRGIQPARQRGQPPTRHPRNRPGQPARRCPDTCRYRSNARSEVAIAFADSTLRPRQ